MNQDAELTTETKTLNNAGGDGSSIAFWRNLIVS